MSVANVNAEHQCLNVLLHSKLCLPLIAERRLQCLFDCFRDLRQRRCHVQLVLEVINKLEGAYGLLFKSAYFPGELVACKRGSPLLLGIKEGSEAETGRPLQSSPMRRHIPGNSFEAFIASDASAFVEYTKQ